MIVFDNVTYRYHYEQFDLLKSLSFTLHDGVNTILCGEQGGKSSLCKLLCNEIVPQSGKITINGIQCNATQDNGVLWLPKNPTVFDNRSVAYNIAYPLKVRKVVKQQRDIIARQLAEQFGLPTDAKAKTLTDEQKRTLAVARGLTINRQVVLFDDFFATKQQLTQTLELFPDAIKVVLTSSTSHAVGNTVVIDCGECIFQGDANQAVAKCDGIVSIIKE